MEFGLLWRELGLSAWEREALGRLGRELPEPEPLRLEPLALVELGRVGLGSGALELEQDGVVASQLELVLLELEPALVPPELALVRPLLGLVDRPTSSAP